MSKITFAEAIKMIDNHIITEVFHSNGINNDCLTEIIKYENLLDVMMAQEIIYKSMRGL